MSITPDEARAVVARWQPILRLADWDIDLRLVDTPWRKTGDVKVDLDDRKAVLLLRATQAPEGLEEVVVHELVHVRLYAMDQMLEQLLDAVFGSDPGDAKRAFAETQFMQLLESTTEDIAKALLAVSGHVGPLTFHRLDREVAEEIAPTPEGAPADEA